MIMKRLALFLIVVLCLCQGTLAQIPAGYYYRANGKQKAELKSALSEVVKEAKMLRYGGSDRKSVV